MDGGWDTLAEGLSEQGLADTEDAAVLVQRISAFLDQHTGTTWGLARYVNPAAPDTLGWGPGLCVLTSSSPTS